MKTKAAPAIACSDLLSNFVRTKQEIENEVVALRALKPVGTFKDATKLKIELAIEELEDGVDDTAEEWDELNDSEQDIVNTARQWKQGESADRPSEGWGALVA